MKSLFTMLAVGSLALVGASLGGCDKGTPSTPSAPKTGAAGVLDKAKDAATKTVDGAKDAAHGAAQAAKDTAAKTGDAVKDAAAKGADVAKGAMDAIKAEGGKWLTDTVGKQWPAAKEAVAGFEKAIPGIKDSGVKGKVEAAVKGLKDQIPQMEGLVGQLTNFKEGDYGSLFTKAKDMFGGFMKKVDEVKAMIPH